MGKSIMEFQNEPPLSQELVIYRWYGVAYIECSKWVKWSINMNYGRDENMDRTCL
jgi:hypothetical protein